ncbi:MAG: hypothetical protein ACI4WX_07565 [Aristaeellaceae bacterium]
MSDKRKARMIDANALKTSFEEDGHLSSYIEEFIDNAPTIDAEPVRHGRWLYNYYPTVWYGHGEPPEWVCSECEERAYNTYDYCPNCGAKMDGGKDGENS